MATYVADNVSIHPRAEIDTDVEIGPFCVIGPNVRIGRGTRLENNVTLMGHVTLGQHNHLYPGVVIGGEPQDLSYRGSDTQVIIGDHNIIRECVTINRGTEKEEGVTTVGRPQLSDGLLPRRPRLPAGQPHRDRQRHAAGRARSRSRSRLALRRRGRAPLCLDRQLQLHQRA